MIKGGPKIVNDGLVLCLDAHDAKSYAGEPVTNLYGDMSTSAGLRGNRTEYNTGGTWPTDMPMCPEPVGRVYKHTSGALTSSWSGNSYGYMYKDIATTSGLMYTLTFWIYLSPDCDIDYMQAVIEGATSNYGAWTGYPSGYDLTKKGTWQLLSKHATADTNVRFLIYPGHTGVTDGSFSGFFAWGGMQVVQAEHVTPFVLSSRSATNGWVDRSGNSNSGTLTNMIGTGASHYRDGQVIMPVANSYLDFDGSNDHIDLGSDISVSPDNQGWTAEYWFNTNSASTLQHFNSAENDEFNANWLAILNSKLAVWNRSPGYWRYGSTQFSSNTWYQAVFICDAGGTNMRFYVNGEAEGGDHVGNVWNASYSSLDVRYIGMYEYNGSYGRFFNGKMASVRIYDRALTAAEVLSNYNATKGRFS